jgi:F-type H+-transporting ATPase subunit b
MVAILASEAGNGWWLPHDPWEILWGSLAFFVVASFLVWKAGPMVKKAFVGRSERIEANLNDVSSDRSAAEAERDATKVALADSDSEAARIVSEARDTAAKVKADLIARAEADAVAIRERGVAEIEAARRSAQADLTAEVARLAAGAAEQVVHANLDDTTQQDLIESYIAQVGADN